MASKTQALMLLLLPFLLLLSRLSSSQAALSCPIVTYWGQHRDEGELQAACDHGYEIINIAFINQIGHGVPTPKLDLTGHCNWITGVPDCTGYASQVTYCQNKGVKIFVSLGGAGGQYTLSSEDEAKQLALHLWNYYLRDDKDSPYTSPIGRVVLDGVDFDIEQAGGTKYWDVVAKELDSYRKKRTTKTFYLSAAPQCPTPDLYLDAAIKTELFDYIWVQFYNNRDCEYDYDDANHARKLIDSWTYWTKNFKAAKFYVGLPASLAANGSLGGYVPVDKLNSDIIPTVQTSPKFGGVMLWNRHQDSLSGYSDHIKCTPPRAFNVVREPLVALMKSASEVLYRLLSQF